MRTVALVLGANASDSRVIVDGVDVSSMCTGVEVEAHVGRPTRITLFLIANCELSAEALDFAIEREDKPVTLDDDERGVDEP